MTWHSPNGGRKAGVREGIFEVTDRKARRVGFRATGSEKATYLGLTGNGGLFVLKALAAWLTGSLAVLSDALNSLTDTFGSIAVLVCVRLGAQEANESHPFGHGRAGRRPGHRHSGGRDGLRDDEARRSVLLGGGRARAVHVPLLIDSPATRNNPSSTDFRGDGSPKRPPVLTEKFPRPA